MSRYKLKFVPEGVFPKDTQIGIHMQPEAPVGVDCCSPECDGWAVTVNDATVTGDVISIDDAAFTLTGTLLGTLCPGQCISWDMRSIAVNTVDAQIADLTMAANGCDGVTLVGAGLLSYAGMEVALFPTIDGKPFCKPIIVRQSTVACFPRGPDAGDGQFNAWDLFNCTEDPNGGTLNASGAQHYARSDSIISETDTGTFGILCVDTITADIGGFSGGDPGVYGHFSVEGNLSYGEPTVPGLRINIFNVGTDHTGITFTISNIRWVDSGNPFGAADYTFTTF